MCDLCVVNVQGWDVRTHIFYDPTNEREATTIKAKRSEALPKWMGLWNEDAEEEIKDCGAVKYRGTHSAPFTVFLPLLLSPIARNKCRCR